MIVASSSVMGAAERRRPRSLGAVHDSARRYHPPLRTAPRGARRNAKRHVQPHHRLRSWSSRSPPASACGPRSAGTSPRPPRRRCRRRRPCACSRSRASCRPFSLQQSDGTRAGARRTQGPLDAGVPRLHPLPGRLPDHAGRTGAGAEAMGSAARRGAAARAVRLGRSRARHRRSASANTRTPSTATPSPPPATCRRWKPSRAVAALVFMKVPPEAATAGRPATASITPPRWPCSIRRAAWPASSSRRWCRRRSPPIPDAHADRGTLIR